jgi:nucleotide-binding universal stress UspA family protein
MTYPTLMVHLDPGVSNPGLLQITADLAERFSAHVIGIAAYQPLQLTCNDGFMSGELVEDDRTEMKSETDEAEALFRATLLGKVSQPEWRRMESPLSLAAYIAEQARSADLLISGPDQRGLQRDFSRAVDVGDLVMHAGRPVLLVPAGVNSLNLRSIVVGWKDTRETRRALSDALPLLKKAGHVTVVEIAIAEELSSARSRLDDVLSWLTRHHITAQSLAVASVGNDAAQLDAIAEEKAADLLVTGAYGHSRLQEWMLGGVTRHLLLNPSRCSLVSH